MQLCLGLCSKVSLKYQFLILFFEFTFLAGLRILFIQRDSCFHCVHRKAWEFCPVLFYCVCVCAVRVYVYVYLCV